MRVPRNYMSSLLNGNSGTSNTSSLLQRALSRSSKSKRSSRSALLTSGKNSRSSLLANTVKSNGNTQRLYYNMKYHAGQVADYAAKMTSDDKNSLFARARENNSTSEIMANVKGFVSQYNSMMQNLRESGGTVNNSYITQLGNIARLSSSELAACGVSRNSDGTLAVDDKKLAEADIDTLEKAWHSSSGFASRTALWADSVESSAERSMKAEASNAYSNPFNYYGNSGNYFNYWR